MIFKPEYTSLLEPRIITPDDDGHYFFGYYDLQPFDSTGRYHLCQRAPFENRIPQPDDICELGAIDLQSGKFIKYAETNAWNFQQGCFLRWFRDDDHIAYNIRHNGAYRTCIQNIRNGEKRILPMAAADISRDGKWGVCVSFSRIFDFRAGYGYAGIPDPFSLQKAPKEDGIFIMDMDSGECRLVANYEKLRDLKYTLPFSDSKLLVNHINFNPSGTRYAMLFRNFNKRGSPWKTQLLTGDLEGNLFCMGDCGFYSHYNWKNDRELLIYSGLSDEAEQKGAPKGLYIFKDLSDEVTLYRTPSPTGELKLATTNLDVHCLYSPNRRYISGDGYPDSDGNRCLHFYDTKDNSEILLGKFRAVYENGEDINWETRSDLHARFDPSGRYITFDTIHTGKRTICMLDLSALEGYEY